MSDAWQRIPRELRDRPQWLLAGPNDEGKLKVPTTIDAAGHPRAGSSTNPATWLTFETACAAARHYGMAIGYVLAEQDPYTCIDLDVKCHLNEPDERKWTPQAHIDSHMAFVNAFQSYTERSISGLGLHIWVQASIGDGCKALSTEVYSWGRFIVCTGDIVLDQPIRPAQEMTEQLVARMRANRKEQAVALDEDAEEEFGDEEIVDKLTNAVNGSKFTALCIGDWKAMGYPSQSEADLALLSMFTFHSRNNEQCRRLFRMTGLGKRDKATKDDVYLNRTLRIIRGRQARELAAEEHGEQVAAALLAALPPAAPQSAPASTQEPAQGAGTTPPPAPPQSNVPNELPWPPGFMGNIARFVYESAPRPVKEVAVVAALGLMAGICGRAWQIPQSGLNMYITLVAQSGVGKEAMHSGISKLLNQIALIPNGTNVHEFVDFTDYASGPALTKAIAFNPCFVNVSGEWGRKLSALAGEEGRTGGPLNSLRTVMTNLYQKSANDSIVGGVGYSDKEKSTGSVSGVAYSMIGETTPGKFYESLTDAMMEDGFLSRFLIIEYDGARPALNNNPRHRLTDEEAYHFISILHHATANKGQNRVTYVGLMQEAAATLHAFNLECDAQINSTKTDEAWRQMWNRAHLKVCRLAALLAVCDYPTEPVVQPQHVEWALTVVRRDISVMARRIAEGDVGTSDHNRERKLLAYLRECLSGVTPGGSYGIPSAMGAAGIVARKYLQIRSQRTPAFTQYKLGATRALDDAIRSLCDSGYMMEVPKEKLMTDYGFHGKAYRVLNLDR